MSSPITLSNFNNIDFNMILDAEMQQESQPLQALQNQEADLSSRGKAYSSLSTTLGSLGTAATGLSTPDAVRQFSATVSNSDILSASAGSGAVAGRYEVVVNELARAQVTVSNTTAPDANTTQVATGGSLTIGGVQVTIGAPVTLQGLADAINGKSGIGVSASVVQSAPGAYRLVLTGLETGTSHAFTISNQLTGGTGVGFIDTDNDAVSGDSAADNAVQATDASVLINNIPITSSSNTLTSGIPGTTLTLTQKNPLQPVVVNVAADNAALISKVQAFVSAYNDVTTFVSDQTTAAASGQTGTIAHDALLRQLRNGLRSSLTATYDGGTFKHLADIGIGFDRNGHLTLDEAALTSAINQDGASVAAVIGGTSGSGGVTGAFSSVDDVINQFTQAGGFVASAQTQIQSQTTRLDSQISDMQARLAVRKAALQQEFIAADQAMSDLKAQSGNLTSFQSSSTSSGLFTNS